MRNFQYSSLLHDYLDINIYSPGWQKAFKDSLCIFHLAGVNFLLYWKNDVWILWIDFRSFKWRSLNQGMRLFVITSCLPNITISQSRQDSLTLSTDHSFALSLVYLVVERKEVANEWSHLASFSTRLRVAHTQCRSGKDMASDNLAAVQYSSPAWTQTVYFHAHIPCREVSWLPAHPLHCWRGSSFVISLTY